MENASRALLMAAGVLIGILMLSLAVYLFATFGAESQELHEKTKHDQVLQFNAQFTIYSGRKDITIYDIISIANLAKETNNYYETFSDFTNNYKVTVAITGISTHSTANFQDEDEEEKQTVLKKYSMDSETHETKKFTCVDIEYHSNGRIKSISFKPT